MNTLTLGCQHANQDLVLPLIIETHKERQYAVHARWPSDGFGFGPVTASIMLCLVCGQVFVPQDQLEAFLDAKAKSKEEHDTLVRRLRAQEEARQLKERESTSGQLSGHKRIPPEKQPK